MDNCLGQTSWLNELYLGWVLIYLDRNSHVQAGPSLPRKVDRNSLAEFVAMSTESPSNLRFYIGGQVDTAATKQELSSQWQRSHNKFLFFDGGSDSKIGKYKRWDGAKYIYDFSFQFISTSIPLHLQQRFPNCDREANQSRSVLVHVLKRSFRALRRVLLSVRCCYI